MDDIEMAFFNESLDLALKVGDQGLKRALRACKRQNELLKIVMTLDRELLGGFGKRAFRRLVPGTGIRRIDTSPKPKATI